MDTKTLSEPRQLERYSFLWSQARLIIAAVALFLGGIPILRFILRGPSFFGFDSLVLTLTWIISGIASIYLFYRWYSQRTLFGKRETVDLVAFLVSIVSGINLGLAGLLGRNIGMSILYNHFVLVVTGLIYLWAAWHLYTRYQKFNEKLF